MGITFLYVDSKPPLNTVQLMGVETRTLHENTKLPPSIDSYDLYQVNNNTTAVIVIVLVGIPARNKMVWVKITDEDSDCGTNTLSLLRIILNI